MKRSQEENILIDINKKGKIVDWRGKKLSSLSLAKRYKSISEKTKPEYERRGVHKRYRKIERKIRNGAGEITGTIISNEPMGLYDRDGKRVVNYEKRAENMKFCGSFLEFLDMPERLKLIKANFCRVPLCPMCQWRKSMRIFFDTSKIMKVVEERYPKYIPLFLTLTVRNCSVEDLSSNLDNIFSGWDDFMRSKTLNPLVKGERKHIVKGWFRALEVEYDGDEKITQTRYNKAKEYYDRNGIKVGDKNLNCNTFHPHFHAIMLVEKSYFKGKDYKRTEEWVQLWRKAAKLDYDPVCHIQRTRTTKGKREEVAEVAKYTYKDAEILNKKLSDDKKDEVVKSLSSAIHGRRIYAYGGVMKEIAAELKVKDVDKADLVNTSDEYEINSALAKMIVTYRWNMGVSNYTFAKNIKFSEKEESVGE